MSHYHDRISALTLRSVDRQTENNDESEVDDFVDPMTYSLARTPALRQGAFELVYRSYLRSGLGTENPFGMRITPYQLRPESQVFVGLVRQEVVSTVTLVADSELGLPMQTMFGPEVHALRQSGHRVAEVSCLADRRTSPIRFINSFFQMTRMMGQFAQLQGISCLLITVHPRHAKFYAKHLNFAPVSERVAECSYVQDRPAAALMLDLRTAAQKQPDWWQDYFRTMLPTSTLEPYRIPAAELTWLTTVAKAANRASMETPNPTGIG